MKRIWLIGITILMIGLWNNLSFAGNYRKNSEPNGFRGIKWGTSLSSLPDMTFTGNSSDDGNFKAYIKKGDNMHIGNAKLKFLLYLFWKGKFYGVGIGTSGFINWNGLKDAVFEKFGKGYQSNKFIKSYVWYGKKTDMTLDYNEISEEANFGMWSYIINKEKDKWEHEKTKEGAKKEF